MAWLAVTAVLALVLSALVMVARQFIHTGSLLGSRKWAQFHDMSGKYVVITGGNIGLGYEAARELLRRGADVTLACRSRERSERVLAEFAQEAAAAKGRPWGRASYLELDLGSFASVRALVDRLAAQKRPLDVLICNAGIFSPNRGTTREGIRETFGVNFVGHFLLVDLLLKQSLLAPQARVVIMSSGTVEYGKWDAGDIENRGSKYVGAGMASGGGLAYSNSKLYMYYFAKELHRRLKSSGSAITTYAVDPGFCWSDLDSHQHGVTHYLLKAVRRLIAKPTALGAQTMVHTASAPGIEAESGQLWVNNAVAPIKNKAAHIEDAPRRLWDFTEKLVASKTQVPAVQPQ